MPPSPWRSAGSSARTPAWPWPPPPWPWRAASHRRAGPGAAGPSTPRRHDAAKAIAAFGTRLRDQVDLDTLTGELLTVADQTMQPTRAWLWLRPSGPADPGARSAGDR